MTTFCGGSPVRRNGRTSRLSKSCVARRIHGANTRQQNRVSKAWPGFSNVISRRSGCQSAYVSGRHVGLSPRRLFARGTMAEDWKPRTNVLRVPGVSNAYQKRVRKRRYKEPAATPLSLAPPPYHNTFGSAVSYDRLGKMLPRGGMQLVRKIKGLQREGRKRKRPSTSALLR